MNQEPGSNERKGGRFSAFNDEQRVILLKYFDEFGMTSTKRCNLPLMTRCAEEIGSTVDKIKNWIGSEAVKRKRKAGILPRPKFEFSSGTTQESKPSIASPPASKKVKRVNGYNLFFSDYVQNHADIGTDFKERNAIVAQKWSELSELERKQWSSKAEIVCSESMQGLRQQIGAASAAAVSSLLSPSTPSATISTDSVMLQSVCSSSSNASLADDNIVEKTLLSIQEKFDLLEQLGFEGYSILVNTSALQTHLIATSKGKSYHKLRQQSSKPLENPFIGHVFSETGVSGDTSTVPPAPTTIISTSSAASPLKLVRVNVGTLPASSTAAPIGLSLQSLESMQKSVMHSFAMKYKVATGRSDVPYDSLDSLGVLVYGMPPGVPFHSPLLYNHQQLQQILANIEKIVFLKNTTDSANLVELSQDNLATTLVSNI